MVRKTTLVNDSGILVARVAHERRRKVNQNYFWKAPCDQMDNKDFEVWLDPLARKSPASTLRGEMIGSLI